MVQEPIKIEKVINDIKVIASKKVASFLENTDNIAYNTIERFGDSTEDVSFCRYSQLTISYNKSREKAKEVGVDLLNKFLKDLVDQEIIFKILEMGILDLPGEDTRNKTSISKDGREVFLGERKRSEKYLCPREYQKQRLMVLLLFAPSKKVIDSNEYRDMTQINLNEWCKENNHLFRFAAEGEVRDNELLVFV